MKITSIAKVFLFLVIVLTFSGCDGKTNSAPVSDPDSLQESSVVEFEYFDEFPTLMKPDYIKGVSLDERTEESDEDEDAVYYRYVYKVNSTVSRTNVIKEYYQAVKDIEFDTINAFHVGDDDGNPEISGNNKHSDGSEDSFIVMTDSDNSNKFIVAINIFGNSPKESNSADSSSTISVPFSITGKWTATETYDHDTYKENDVPYGSVWVSFNADGTYEWYSQSVDVTGEYEQSDNVYFLY